MELARPPFALEASGRRRIARTDPRHFGRGPARDAGPVAIKPLLGDDFKLFATTFLAGFLFVSVLIG